MTVLRGANQLQTLPTGTPFGTRWVQSVIDSGDPLCLLLLPLSQDGGHFTCGCLMSSSRYLLSGASDGLLMLWDIKNKSSTKTFEVSFRMERTHYSTIPSNCRYSLSSVYCFSHYPSLCGEMLIKHI